MPDKILVIGAAHLDIAGDYSKSVADTVDKPGVIMYSVGGTGYNIAANIAQNAAPVQFLSALRSESLITPIILSRLQSYKIDTRSVIVLENIDESGFIAQREEGQLVSAVTSSTMEKFLLAYVDLISEVRNASLVVCDCNVSSAVLNEVVRSCGIHEKKLMVAGVSESKAHKMLDIDRDLGRPFPIFVASMNKYEAEAVGIRSNIKSKESVRRACEKIGSEYLVVTDGENGYKIFCNTGMQFAYDAPVVANIVSQTGSGDALLSAICYYYWKHKNLNWADCNKVIGRFVGEVLKHRGATVGAEAFPHEMKVVPSRELDALKIRQSDKVYAALEHGLASIGKKFGVAEALGLIAALVSILTYLYGDFSKTEEYVIDLITHLGIGH